MHPTVYMYNVYVGCTMYTCTMYIVQGGLYRVHYTKTYRTVCTVLYLPLKTSNLIKITSINIDFTVELCMMYTLVF